MQTSPFTHTPMTAQNPDPQNESPPDAQPTHFSEALGGILERGEAKVLAAHLGVKESFVSKLRNGGTGPISPALCARIISFFRGSPERQDILVRARMRDCLPEETYARHFYPESSRLREDSPGEAISIGEKLDRLAVIAAANPSTRSLLEFLHAEAEREEKARG